MPFFIYLLSFQIGLLPANHYPRTPAMAAGISDHIWLVEEIVRLTNV